MNHCFHTLKLSAAVLLGLAAASGFEAQTVQNGSFELPALTGNIAEGSGADWTPTSSPVGSPYVLTNDYGYGTTSYGNQWEELNPGSTVTQTITSGFTLNARYTLSLVSSAVFNTTNDQLIVTVSGGATAAQTFALPARTGALGGALPFVTYTVDFSRRPARR